MINKSMNYAKIYQQLVERAQTRGTPAYYEIHHIVPRCMSGTDDPNNLVALTPEEHYIAHQLLLKMYPDHKQLAHAANMMTVNRTNNKLYGWVRQRLSESMKENNPNAGGNSRREYNAKYGSPNRGYSHTEENKELFRQQKLGKKNPNADGAARRTVTYLIDENTHVVTPYPSLKEAEEAKGVNHSSVYYNRVRKRPHRGFYWCVGKEEFHDIMNKI
jgi:hypothetical protein